jgi:hypothetical protein
MLTLLQRVHLGGPLHQPRNLLFRYVTEQTRHRRVRVQSCTFGGKQAQTTCGRYCANLVGVNRGPPEISADESNAGAAFYRQKPSGIGIVFISVREPLLRQACDHGGLRCGVHRCLAGNVLPN